MESVPQPLASQLCRQAQDNQIIKVFTQCWGCVRFSKGDPAKMCGGIVACNLVLARYHKLKRKGDLPPAR